MRMPFGKYRNQEVEEVPSGYLVWLLEDGCSLAPWLEKHVRLVLAARLELATPSIGIDATKLKTALAAWFRAQAMKHHPDRGGTSEVMVALNAIRDELAELIARLEGGAHA